MSPNPIRSLARPVVRALPPAVRTPLLRAYRAGRSRAEGLQASRTSVDGMRRYSFEPVPDSAVRLLVAPVNSAGQGYLWARACQEHSPGVQARSLALTNRYTFPVDYVVDPADYWTREWGGAHERYVAASFTHVLVESERPVFGGAYGRDVGPELPVMQRAGLQVALVSHGSDSRIPSRHAEREPWSPFRDTDWDIVPRLEKGAARDNATLRTYEGHVLVSTPDLLDDVPEATWCPLVVDLPRWAAEPSAFARRRPLVVHAPSNPRMKGSDLIDPVVESLHRRGMVEYRRLEGLTTDEMVRAYQGADVVLDQFRIGSYGATACEAMASGNVVVGHVSDEVRERVREGTGRELPVVEATADDLEEVLVALADDLDRARDLAADAVSFVRTVHDGRTAADALTPFLAGAPR